MRVLNPSNSVLWFLLAASLALAPTPAAATQSWAFSWSKRPPEGESAKAPAVSLSGDQLVEIKVAGVNQIFYTYSMSCTAKPTESPLGLWAAMFTGVKKSNESPDEDCQSKVADLQARIKTYSSSPGADPEAKPKSIPVGETIAQLQEFAGQVKLLQEGICKGADEAPRLKEIAKNLKGLVDRPTFVTFVQTISPDYEYTCTVAESFKGKPTEGGTLQIAINPSNSIATLSVGALASSVPTRSFEIVNAPNADNTGGMNVLAVQGDSISGHVAALINFRLPFLRQLRGDDWGVDATFGPVFRVGSSGDTSAVGFFGGLSLRLHRYLFITPGIHLAPVADYPIGFSQPGQIVPPNFGTPTPIQRTTARFGVAISVQTKSFGALGDSRVTSLPILPPAPAEEEPGEGEGENATPAQEAALPELPDQIILKKEGDRYAGEVTVKNTSKDKAWNVEVDASDKVTFSGEDCCKALAPGSPCDVKITYTKPEGSDTPAELSLTLRFDHLDPPDDVHSIPLVLEEAEEQP